MANSVLEDEIIEMMEQVNAFQLKIEEAEAVFKTTQEKVAISRKSVESQAVSIQGDIERLEGELKQCEAELPELIRDTYLRLVRQKGEDALAEVVEGAAPAATSRCPSTCRPTFASCSPASAAPAADCCMLRRRSNPRIPRLYCSRVKLIPARRASEGC